MKKHTIIQFIKSKSFYVILSVAIVAVAAVTIIGLNLKSKNSKQENLADLNSPVEIAENDGINVEENLLDKVNTDNALSSESDTANEDTSLSNDELLEFDIESYTAQEDLDLFVQNDDMKQEAENEPVDATIGEAQVQEENPTKEDETLPVVQPRVTLESLVFNEESSLTWPVKGNVVMSFSNDKLIHYATLDEWKTNPAIVISSETGTNVLCAAKGIVNSIEYNEETGTTVTMSIGNGYEAVYGQLNEVTCAVGDAVEEGTVIGKVATPTKYYMVEGSNVYFKIVRDGAPVNPMLFLAANE